MLQTARKILLLISLASVYLPLSSHPIKQKIPASVSEIKAMEREIWNLLNEERAFENLPPLKLNEALSDLARKHSQDMADMRELSHRSSDGKTLANRLERAGIYYIEAGENVAFSQTFVAEFIHEYLIESPEHKENILDPDFQEVGIGIVYKKDKGYYVTQDFLRPLIPRTDRDVKRIIQHNINIRRQAHSLPPLDFLENRENFAQDLSMRKARGRKLPPIPETFGETLVIFLATPSLSDESVVFKDASNPRYDRAALGIWFAKNKKYRGGAYFLTLMLFASNRYRDVNKKDQMEIILVEVNRLRAKFGLKSLKLDGRLTELAEQMVTKVAGQRGSAIRVFPEYRRYEVFTYGTEDLTLLPGSMAAKVKNSGLRRIGIGILFSVNPVSPDGAFWVALIFE